MHKKSVVDNKPIGDVVASPSERVSQTIVCPYLALFDDPSTKLLFPSPSGYCHHVEPEQAISLEHQQSFCLNAQHMICSAFVTENLHALPAGLERSIPRDNGRFIKTIILLAGFIAAIFFGALLLSGNNASPPLVDNTVDDNNGNNVAVLPLTTTLPAATTVATVIATSTPTDIPPSPTPPPTLIPTTSPTPLPSPTAEPTAAPTSIPSPTPKPLPVAEVIPNRLNIRGGPSTDYPVLTIVDSGTLFDIVGQLSDGTWYQLCCVGDDNTEGWVLAESITITGIVDEIPVATNIPPLSGN